MSPILDAYLQNKAAIKRFVRRFVPRSDDAEDVAQEAFLRAFAAEAVQSIASPKAYLFKVARNLALNERAKVSHATTDALEEIPEQAVLANGSQVTLDDEMDARQRVRVLAQAVAALPPQCSRVFVLRKVHGLSHKEIAERLEISVSTVEKHVALGLLRCSDYLRQQGYEVGQPGHRAERARKDSAVGQVASLGLKRQNNDG